MYRKWNVIIGCIPQSARPCCRQLIISLIWIPQRFLGNKIRGKTLFLSRKKTELLLQLLAFQTECYFERRRNCNLILTIVVIRNFISRRLPFLLSDWDYSIFLQNRKIYCQLNRPRLRLHSTREVFIVYFTLYLKVFSLCSRF